MRLFRKLSLNSFFFLLLGVVQAETLTYNLSTPERAWDSVLMALRTGNEKDVKKVTTANGFKTLSRFADNEPLSERFIRWGKGWQKWEIRWKERDSKVARANAGPEIKEAGLNFVKTRDGWKLDAWHPGE